MPKGPEAPKELEESAPDITGGDVELAMISADQC